MGNTSEDMPSIEEMDKKEVSFRKKLKSEGHTCIKILESYPSQTEWCKQKECVKKIFSTEEECKQSTDYPDNFLDILEKQGHECAAIHTNPPFMSNPGKQLSWCRQPVCSGKYTMGLPDGTVQRIR